MGFGFMGKLEEIKAALLKAKDDTPGLYADWIVAVSEELADIERRLGRIERKLRNR